MAITKETPAAAADTDAVQQVPGWRREHHHQHVTGEHVGEQPDRVGERPDEQVREELEA